MICSTVSGYATIVLKKRKVKENYNNLFLPGDWEPFQESGSNQHPLTVLQSPAL